MMTSQRSLQHVSPGSLCASHHVRVAPRAVAHGRRPLQVQAVQTDVMVGAATLAAATVQSAFSAGLFGGAFGAISGLSKRGKPVVHEAIEGFSSTARVGALMGLSAGTLFNLGMEGRAANIGGIAAGIGLYYALMTVANRSE